MAFSFIKNQYFNEVKKFYEQQINNENLTEWEKKILSNLEEVCKIDSDTIQDFETYNLEVKKRSDLNLKIVFDNKYGELGHHINLNNEIEYLNVLIYSYYKELHFRTNIKNNEMYKFIPFIEKNKENFSQEVKYIFRFVDNLPFSIMSDLYRNPNLQKISELSEFNNVSKYIEYIELNNQNITQINNWNSDFDEKVRIVKKLNEKLEEQKLTYDFVLLNQGFKKLYDQKKIDLNKPTISVSWFLRTILAIPILEIIFFAVLLVLEKAINSVTVWFVLVPSISLILFLFYFYKINLQEVRSIKSQMMQLELRMALCQFIHNYAEDSELLHNKNKDGFDKFENIIFSPIVSSDDKIPTTFDGVDQLAKLIEAIRK
ncbi:hypothetical protein [Acinetobacter bereziniae]|uniref:hypothetical protein n=1 Tax=Acinetobacter bereziniae TaxID=106648 RepID=UPI001250B8CA|nr:hypothetical protein [Acinetobacter bereziniae]